MPELLKRKLEKQGVDNPYAVMNSMGAMKGSKITAKGRRIENKLRKRRKHDAKDAGDALAKAD